MWNITFGQQLKDTDVGDLVILMKTLMAAVSISKFSATNLNYVNKVQFKPD
jgi:hypothetical protein